MADSALTTLLKRAMKAFLRARGYHVMRMTPEDLKEVDAPYDAALPLPQDAARALSATHPRLAELREAYGRLDLPVLRHSQWGPDAFPVQVDLAHFRGQSPYVHQYRQQETPRSVRLKYFVYLRYLAERDQASLLTRAEEDGAFGCWTYRYPGYPAVSRDLLDSVAEILFLERHLGVLTRPTLSVLDIGAGYGRLAHRMTELVPGLTDYCCVDAVPESTFLSEYYLRYRRCTGRTRVVPLHEMEQNLRPDHFDLAVNIHCFSECSVAAIEWWMGLLNRLRIPNLLIVPNDEGRLLSLEADGSRRDYAPALNAAGYYRAHVEPMLQDAAVRELLGVRDEFHFFRRST